MKKNFLFTILIILLIFSLACNFASSITGNQAPEEETPAAEIPEETEETDPSTAHAGPCNNILYPLIPGQQMVYKSSSPEGPAQTGITVASVEGNIAIIDMLNLTTGITSQSTAECEAGAIKSYPTASLGSLIDNMVDGTMTMDYLADHWHGRKYHCRGRYLYQRH